MMLPIIPMLVVCVFSSLHADAAKHEAQLHEAKKNNVEKVGLARDLRTTTITIDDSNASTYINGFEVPTATIYEWNVSDPSSSIIQGPITFADYSAVLQLDIDIILADPDYISGDNYINLDPASYTVQNGADNNTVLVQGINADNFSDYNNGSLSIPANTTYVWNTNSTYRGVDTIPFADITARLQLNSNMNLSSSSGFDPNNFVNVVPKHFAVSARGQILLQGIDAQNSSNYVGGFEIPSGQTYIWDCTDVLNASIEFEDSTAYLQLNSDMFLGDPSYIPFDNYANMYPQHFKVRDSSNNNLVLLQGVDDSNSKLYTASFTNRPNITYIWKSYGPTGGLLWSNKSGHKTRAFLDAQEVPTSGK